jgi:hypothetical protein
MYTERIVYLCSAKHVRTMYNSAKVIVDDFCPDCLMDSKTSDSKWRPSFREIS